MDADVDDHPSWRKGGCLMPKKPPGSGRSSKCRKGRIAPPTPEEWAAAEVAKSPDLSERQTKDLLRIPGLNEED